MRDHYAITSESIKEPPSAFADKLKFLGPGFILSASIVGSGELIATTTLGAKAGFTALWIIILSCLAKVAVQLEFGKHTITSGETAMQAFNKLPGIRMGRGNWTVWLVFALILLKIVQLGGMIGSAGIVVHMLVPTVSVPVAVLMMALLLSVLIYKGYYSLVEKSSLIMTLLFTLMTLAAVGFLSFTKYAITWTEIASGFTFELSASIVGVAIGAFGITGVASDEIIAYNYWCLEKGYAAYAGPKDDSEAWRRRATGWINVMYLDAGVAMLIYTTVTAAFYLLGAAILNNQGLVPEGNDLIETVATIYTTSLGPGIRSVYLVGAFFVLFSSLFASLAAWSRMYADIFGQLGWINFYDARQRRRVIAVLAWTCPAIWAIVYLLMSLPVVMILFGGVVGSVLLLIVVFAAIHFRYKQFQLQKPGWLYNIAFWVSILSICFVGVYGILVIL
ncbi:MAG: Nramp family divalent metal transporter [Chryseolinea sp.]